jgi:hypothetical protein
MNRGWRISARRKLKCRAATKKTCRLPKCEPLSFTSAPLPGFQQFAQDAAQADDAGEKAERAAHALFESSNHGRRRHAGADAYHQACSQQSEEGVDLELADHHHDQEYRGAQDD